LSAVTIALGLSSGPAIIIDWYLNLPHIHGWCRT
jgi:hypothetical protein